MLPDLFEYEKNAARDIHAMFIHTQPMLIKWRSPGGRSTHPQKAKSIHTSEQGKPRLLLLLLPSAPGSQPHPVTLSGRNTGCNLSDLLGWPPHGGPDATPLQASVLDTFICLHSLLPPHFLPLCSSVSPSRSAGAL